MFCALGSSRRVDVRSDPAVPAVPPLQQDIILENVSYTGSIDPRYLAMYVTDPDPL